MKEYLLAFTALLFLALLLYRLIRSIWLSQRLSADTHSPGCAIPGELQAKVDAATTPARARELLREIERRASGERANKRACYYVASAEVARTVLKRQNVSVHFYIRALRNDPACEPALERLITALLAQKKTRLLERHCWSLLSRMGPEHTGGAVWIKCWTTLGNLYAANPRQLERSDAIRKMLNFAVAEDDDEFSDNDTSRDSDLPGANSPDDNQQLTTND